MYCPRPPLFRQREGEFHTPYLQSDLEKREWICYIDTKNHENKGEDLLHRFRRRGKDGHRFRGFGVRAGRGHAQRPGPYSRRPILRIARSVPPPIATFLLTCETQAAAIIAHHRRTLTNTLQLVDAPEAGAIAAIRFVLPVVRIVQVVHVRSEESIDEALQAAGEVDALLLDSGNPALAVKELGGTGRVHDWRLSRRIVEQSPVPVFLAGGLSSENVRSAIDAVQPA